jgi:D-alanyl-lipoteichoic acid acyltransferase DltB (MBOAT superfamily)
MLLVASYIFYGAWDWRFLSLLFLSTIIDYICALKIYESNELKRRKLFLCVSIIASLSILSFFKYFNFFAESFQALLSYFGFSVHPRFLNIILPVGISFYTFQTMSYVIDVYRKELGATKNLFDFALFVTYFPQLVAGPIERASHLLPQVLSERKIKLNEFYQGCYLIFWGLFLKIFVADNLAEIVDPVFISNAPYNGLQVLLAIYAFAFQIFCDFAGYSEIAIGLGKIMGFDIMVNFNLPYFATNPREFWKRWHISLSTWLRDYLYIPLGGNKKGVIKTYRNLAITMFLGGLWHGAAWTFVIWGVYQGILLIIHRLLEPLLKRVPEPKTIFGRRLYFALRVIFFFHLICLGWLVFRAMSMGQVFSMLHSLIFNFHFIPGIGIEHTVFKMIFYLWILLFLQLLQYRTGNRMVVIEWPKPVRFAFYSAVLLLMMTFGVLGQNQFIYFQF